MARRASDVSTLSAQQQQQQQHHQQQRAVHFTDESPDGVNTTAAGDPRLHGVVDGVFVRCLAPVIRSTQEQIQQVHQQQQQQAQQPATWSRASTPPPPSAAAQQQQQRSARESPERGLTSAAAAANDDAATETNSVAPAPRLGHPKQQPAVTTAASTSSSKQQHHSVVAWCADADGTITVRRGDAPSKVLARIPKKDHLFVTALVQVGLTHVWAGYSDGCIRVYDFNSASSSSAAATTTTSLVQELYHHDGAVCTLTLGSDSLVYSGGQDWKILQWDPVQRTFLRLFFGHTNSVRCVVTAQGNPWRNVFLSHQRKRGANANAAASNAAAATTDDERPPPPSSREAHMQMLVNPQPNNNNNSGNISSKNSNKDNSSGGQSLLILPRRSVLFTGSDDGTIRVWDALAPRQHTKDIACLHSFTGAHGKNSGIHALLLHVDTKTLWSGGEDHAVVVWDLEHCVELTKLAHQHSAPITAIEALENGTIWTGGKDGLVVIWDALSRAPLRDFRAGGGVYVSAICTMAKTECRKVWCAFSDGTMQVWNVEVPFGAGLQVFADQLLQQKQQHQQQAQLQIEQQQADQQQHQDTSSALTRPHLHRSGSDVNNSSSSAVAAADAANIDPTAARLESKLRFSESVIRSCRSAIKATEEERDAAKLRASELEWQLNEAKQQLEEVRQMQAQQQHQQKHVEEAAHQEKQQQDDVPASQDVSPIKAHSQQEEQDTEQKLQQPHSDATQHQQQHASPPNPRFGAGGASGRRNLELAAAVQLAERQSEECDRLQAELMQVKEELERAKEEIIIAQKQQQAQQRSSSAARPEAVLKSSVPRDDESESAVERNNNNNDRDDDNDKLTVSSSLGEQPRKTAPPRKSPAGSSSSAASPERDPPAPNERLPYEVLAEKLRMAETQLEEERGKNEQLWNENEALTTALNNSSNNSKQKQQQEQEEAAAAALQAEKEKQEQQQQQQLLLEQVRQLTEQLDSLEKQVDSNKEQHTAALTESQQKCAALEAELTSVRDKHDELALNEQKRKAAVERALSSSPTASTARSRDRADNNNDDAEPATATVTAAITAAALEELQAQNAALQDKIVEQDSKLDALTAEVASQRAACAAAESSQRQEQLRAFFATDDAQRAAITSEEALAAAKLSEFSALLFKEQMTELAEYLQSVRDECAAVTSDRDRRKQQCEALELQLSDTQKQRDALQERLRGAVSKAAVLYAETGSMRRALSSFKEQHSVYRERQDDTNKKVAAAASEMLVRIEELREKLHVQEQRAFEAEQACVAAEVRAEEAASLMQAKQLELDIACASLRALGREMTRSALEQPSAAAEGENDEVFSPRRAIEQAAASISAKNSAAELSPSSIARRRRVQQQQQQNQQRDSNNNSSDSTAAALLLPHVNDEVPYHALVAQLSQVKSTVHSMTAANDARQQLLNELNLRHSSDVRTIAALQARIEKLARNNNNSNTKQSALEEDEANAAMEAEEEQMRKDEEATSQLESMQVALRNSVEAQRSISQEVRQLRKAMAAIAEFDEENSSNSNNSKSTKQLQIAIRELVSLLDAKQKVVADQREIISESCRLTQLLNQRLEFATATTTATVAVEQEVAEEEDVDQQQLQAEGDENNQNDNSDSNKESSVAVHREEYIQLRTSLDSLLQLVETAFQPETEECKEQQQPHDNEDDQQQTQHRRGTRAEREERRLNESLDAAGTPPRIRHHRSSSNTDLSAAGAQDENDDDHKSNASEDNEASEQQPQRKNNAISSPQQTLSDRIRNASEAITLHLSRIAHVDDTIVSLMRQLFEVSTTEAISPDMLRQHIPHSQYAALAKQGKVPPLLSRFNNTNNSSSQQAQEGEEQAAATSTNDDDENPFVALIRRSNSNKNNGNGGFVQTPTFAAHAWESCMREVITRATERLHIQRLAFDGALRRMQSLKDRVLLLSQESKNSADALEKQAAALQAKEHDTLREWHEQHREEMVVAVWDTFCGVKAGLQRLSQHTARLQAQLPREWRSLNMAADVNQVISNFSIAFNRSQFILAECLTDEEKEELERLGRERRSVSQHQHQQQQPQQGNTNVSMNNYDNLGAAFVSRSPGPSTPSRTPRHMSSLDQQQQQLTPRVGIPVPIPQSSSGEVVGR